MKSQKTAPLSSPSGSSEITTPPSSSPVSRKTSLKIPLSEFAERTETEYQTLADEVISKLKDRKFDTIIFDFDGTLTKRHTARVSSEDFNPSDDWFADKKILKEILEKGRNNGIKFYITSNQSQKIIEDILEAHELQDYFDEVLGQSSVAKLKSSNIETIAQIESNTKILYLDDDAEDIENEKITTIKGLLPMLSSKEDLRRPNKKDVNGEAGITFEKWQTIATCLETEKYRVGSTSSSHESLFTFPSFNPESTDAGSNFFQESLVRLIDQGKNTSSNEVQKKYYSQR